MIYLVRTLKEIDGQTISTDFVIEAEEKSILRDFLDEHKLVVLSFSEVKQRPQSANLFGTLVFDDKKHTFCLKASSIENAIKRSILLDLPLEEMRDKRDKSSRQKSLEIIKFEKEKKRKKEEEEKKQRKSKKKKKYKDTKRKKTVAVINNTIKDIGRIQENYTNNHTYQQHKRTLKNLRDELSKIRMGTNLVKANKILENAFDIMEKIELSHIEALEEEEYTISDTSVVSNIDIINELDNIKRAQQVQQIGGKQTTSDLYYTYLGILGIYQKFIAKDIVKQFKQIQKTSYSFSRYIDFTILSISLFVTIIFFYQIISHNNNSRIFFSLIVLGSLGLIWTMITRIIGRKSLGKIIASIILAIVFTTIIYNIIIVYFALL